MYLKQNQVFGTDGAVVFPELRELATGELCQSFLMYCQKNLLHVACSGSFDHLTKTVTKNILRTILTYL